MNNRKIYSKWVDKNKKEFVLLYPTSMKIGFIFKKWKKGILYAELIDSKRIGQTYVLPEKRFQKTFTRVGSFITKMYKVRRPIND